MNLGRLLQRASLVLLPLIALAQSVPPLFPDRPFDPNEFSHLTASRSDQMPPSLIRGARRDQLQRIAEWVPPTSYSLPRLERRSRQTHPISGQPTIGESRSLPANLKQSWNSSKLLGKGTIWRLRIHSPGAKALRLHFDNFDIGDGKLWIYPDAERVSPPAILGPYTGKGTFGDGEFWTGSIFSDSAVLEVLLDSKSSDAAFLPPGVDRILHFYAATDQSIPLQEAAARRTPSLLFADENSGKPEQDLIGTAHLLGDQSESPNAITVNFAAPCHADATCYPQYSGLAAATLHYTYESGNSAYMCSGSLINTRSSSRRPFVATANHCISSDAEARTVEAYFNYATPVCNRGPVDRDLTTRVLGGVSNHPKT